MAAVLPSIALLVYLREPSVHSSLARNGREGLTAGGFLVVQCGCSPSCSVCPWLWL